MSNDTANYNSSNFNQIIRINDNIISSSSVKNTPDIKEIEKIKEKIICNNLERDVSKPVFTLNDDKCLNLRTKENFSSVNNMPLLSSSGSSYIINNCNHRSLPNFQIQCKSNQQINENNNASKIEILSAVTSSSSNSSNSTSSDETTTNEETEINNLTKNSLNIPLSTSSNQVLQKDDQISTLLNFSSNLSSSSSSAISSSLSNVQSPNLNNQALLFSKTTNSSKITSNEEQRNYETLNDNKFFFNKRKIIKNKFESRCKSLDLSEKKNQNKINAKDDKIIKSASKVYNSSSINNFFFILWKLSHHQKSTLLKTKSFNSFLSKKGT
jgi:hypothetical protein